MIQYITPRRVCKRILSHGMRTFCPAFRLNGRKILPAQEIVHKLSVDICPPLRYNAYTCAWIKHVRSYYICEKEKSKHCCLSSFFCW